MSNMALIVQDFLVDTIRELRDCRSMGTQWSLKFGGSEGLLRVGLSESSSKVFQDCRRCFLGRGVLVATYREAKKPPLPMPSRFLATVFLEFFLY